MILLTFTLELQIFWNKKENTIPIWKLLKLFYWLYGCQTTINPKSQFWLITKFDTIEHFWLRHEPYEAPFNDCLSILYKAQTFNLKLKANKFIKWVHMSQWVLYIIIKGGAWVFFVSLIFMTKCIWGNVLGCGPACHASTMHSIWAALPSACDGEIDV